MIISKEYKFVFISIPNTGTTSIMKVLAKYNNYPDVAKCTSLIDLEKRNINIDGYFKFCFVRNPYHRFASSYHRYMSHASNGSKLNFCEFLKIYKNMSVYQSQCNMTVGMDFVGKLENLQGDFDYICDKIKIPRVVLSHENSSGAKNHMSYYTEDVMPLAIELFSNEVKEFGYEL